MLVLPLPPSHKRMRVNVQVFSYKTWDISPKQFSTECPAEQPEFGTACSLPEGAQCPYGEECCCGECHPKWGKTPRRTFLIQKVFSSPLTMWTMPPQIRKITQRTFLIQKVRSSLNKAHVSSTLLKCSPSEENSSNMYVPSTFHTRPSGPENTWWLKHTW